MTHSASSMDIAGHNSDSTAPFGGVMARSCPKPIVMPRRSRRGSLTTNQEELTVFVPPHEIVASSLMDPTNVSNTDLAAATAVAYRMCTPNMTHVQQNP